MHQPSSTTPFLALPWEIRDAIYSALLESEEPTPAGGVETQILVHRGQRQVASSRALSPAVLATAGMLRCNQQISSELTAKMAAWQARGRTVYKLLYTFRGKSEPSRSWRRLTVPLRYLHTLQLDVWPRSGMHAYSPHLRSVASDIERVVFDFFDCGPALKSPRALKVRPKVVVVLVNFLEPEVPDAPSGAEEEDWDTEFKAKDPLETAMPRFYQETISNMLNSYYFDELENYLAGNVEMLRIAVQGHLFERKLMVAEGEEAPDECLA